MRSLWKATKRGAIKLIFLLIPLIGWTEGAFGLISDDKIVLVNILMLVLLDLLVYPRIFNWWKPGQMSKKKKISIEQAIEQAGEDIARGLRALTAQRKVAEECARMVEQSNAHPAERAHIAAKIRHKFKICQYDLQGQTLDWDQDPPP